MARRKSNTQDSIKKDNETLSKETPEVQEKLLEGLVNLEEMTSYQEDPQAKTVVIQAVTPKKAIIVEEGLKIGDKVKIDKKVTADMLGRRIHNGIKNYTYKVLNVRSDGYVSIECLTYAFLVHKSLLIKI